MGLDGFRFEHDKAHAWRCFSFHHFQPSLQDNVDQSCPVNQSCPVRRAGQSRNR